MAFLSLLSCLVCRTTSAVFAKGRRTLYIFGFLPLVYYVFDYISTKFSGLLYSGNKAVVEFMGFIFCISYVVFLLVYFREYEKKQEVSQYNALMKMQLTSLQNEIEQVHLSKKTLSILRHDMRHHLNILLTQLHNGNIDQAMDYIRRIDGAYDETVITAYCKNDMVNSVISIYQTRFSQNGHHFLSPAKRRIFCSDRRILPVSRPGLWTASRFPAKQPRHRSKKYYPLCESTQRAVPFFSVRKQFRSEDHYLIPEIQERGCL